MDIDSGHSNQMLGAQPCRHSGEVLWIRLQKISIIGSIHSSFYIIETTIMIEWWHLVSLLDCQELKPVNPKGNQPWIFIGRTEAEASILWSLDAKSQLIGKEPNARKDGQQKEEGVTEGQMVGWHPWVNGHEFEQILGDSEGQRSLVCFSLVRSQRVRHNLVTRQQQL